MKPKDITDCPGAWYGNTPKQEALSQGNVVVDPKQICAALKYLWRRYWVFEETSLTSDGGIFIRVQHKSPKFQ